MEYSASWINLTNRPMKFLVDEEKDTHYIRMMIKDASFTAFLHLCSQISDSKKIKWLPFLYPIPFY